MTANYDLEILRQRVADATAAIKTLQTHDAADWMRWRLEHLRRELEEFAATVWPGGDDKKGAEK